MVSLSKAGEESFSMFKQSVNDGNDHVVDNNEEKDIDDVEKLFVKRKLKNLKDANRAFTDEMTRSGSDEETISKMLIADKFLPNPPEIRHMTPRFSQFDLYNTGNPEFPGSCTGTPNICDILPENKFTQILSVKRERLEKEIKDLIATLEERSDKLRQAMAIREQEILSHSPLHESTLETCKQVRKLEYELAQIRSETCEINPAEGANIKQFCCKFEIKKVIKLQRKVDKLRNLALLKACDLKVLDDAKDRLNIEIANLNDDIKNSMKIIDDYETELQDISQDIQSVINSEYAQKPAKEQVQVEEEIPFSQGISDWSIDDPPPPENRKPPRLPHKEQPPTEDRASICPQKPFGVKPKTPGRCCPPTQVPRKNIVPTQPPEKQIPEKRSPQIPRSKPVDKDNLPCGKNGAIKTPRKTTPPKYIEKVEPIEPKQPGTPEKREIPLPESPRLPPVENPPQPFEPNESRIKPAEEEVDEESSSSSYLKDLYESTPLAESSENITQVRKTVDISGSTENPSPIERIENTTIGHGGIVEATDLDIEAVNVEAAIGNIEESLSHKCDSREYETAQLEDSSIGSGNTNKSDKNAQVTLQTQEGNKTEVKNCNDALSNYPDQVAVEDCTTSSISELITKNNDIRSRDNQQHDETTNESYSSEVTVKCCCKCASKNQEKVEWTGLVNVKDPSCTEAQSRLHRTERTTDADKQHYISQNSSQYPANVINTTFGSKANECLSLSTTSELETEEQSSKTTSVDVKDFNRRNDDPDGPAPDATRKNDSRQNDDLSHQKYTKSPRNGYSYTDGNRRRSNEKRQTSQNKSGMYSNYYETIREAGNRPNKYKENNKLSTIHEKRKSRNVPNGVEFDKVTGECFQGSFVNKILKRCSAVAPNISTVKNRKAFAQTSQNLRVRRLTETKQTQTKPISSKRSASQKSTGNRDEVVVTKHEETAFKENRMTAHSNMKVLPRDKIHFAKNDGTAVDSTKIHSQAKRLEEGLQHYRHLYSALKEKNRDLTERFVNSQINLGRYKENYEKLLLDNQKAENLADEIVQLRQRNTELQKQVTETVSQLNKKDFENKSLIIENERFRSEYNEKVATTGTTVENMNYIQKIYRLEEQVLYLSDQNKTMLRNYEDSQKLLQQAEQKVKAICEELRQLPNGTSVLDHPSSDASHNDWLNYSKVMTDKLNEFKQKLDRTNFLLKIIEEERDELKKENCEVRNILQKSENKISQLLTDRNSPSLQSQVAFLSEEFEKQVILTKKYEDQVKQLSKQNLEVTEQLKKAELKLVDYRETLDSLRTYKEEILKIQSLDKAEHCGRTKRSQPHNVNNRRRDASCDSNQEQSFTLVGSQNSNENTHYEPASTETKSSTNPKSWTSKALNSVLNRHSKGLPKNASRRHRSSYSRSKLIDTSTPSTKGDNEPTEFELVYSFLHQEISKNLKKMQAKVESKPIRQELNDIRHSLEWSRRKVLDMSIQSQATKTMPLPSENPLCSLLGNIFQKIMSRGTDALNRNEILYLHSIVYKAGVECSKNSKKRSGLSANRPAESFNNGKVMDLQTNINRTKRTLGQFRTFQRF